MVSESGSGDEKRMPERRNPEESAKTKERVEVVIRHSFDGLELSDKIRSAIAESVVQLLRRHGVLDGLFGGGSEGGA